MSQPVTEEYAPNDLEQRLEHDTAIPVRVVREPGEHSAAAEHVSWSSVVLGGAEQAFQLLAFSRKRSKANINIVAAPGVATVQFVRLGRANQAAAQNGGALYATPLSLTYSAQPEVWVVPQPVNGQVLITVEEERYG